MRFQQLLWPVLMALGFAFEAAAATAEPVASDDRQNPPAVWLARAPGTALRVLSWNVSRDSFYVNLDAFHRVLAAIDADILILDEMPGTSNAAELRAALGGLGDAAAEWQVAYGEGGGVFQRSTIASRNPTTRLPIFETLRYAPEQISAWLGQAGSSGGRLRDNLQAGVAAVGAHILHDGKTLLVVAMDLQCCGDDAGSWQESRRRAEAGLLRQALLSSVQQTPVAAVIVAGDANTVQGVQAISILRGTPSAGADPEPWRLQEVAARHQGKSSTWTWDGRGTPYPSSRLDHILHSAALQPLQASIFDTEDLSAAQAKALRLPKEVSRRLSEHRPIVVDFRWVD